MQLKLKSFPLAALTAAYAVMWIGGVGHYALFGGPSQLQALDAPWAASVFLTLAGLLVVMTSRGSDLIGLLAAALIGFTAEIIGVRYGFIFSPYHYTDVLQPQFLGAPLVMLSAWMVLTSYCRQMLGPLSLPRLIESTLAAMWMTAIDLVIDPLAANQLGYWRWERPGAYYGIPLQNFVGWLVVSFIIFSVLSWRPPKTPFEIRIGQKNRTARYIGLSIVLFFTVIALSYGLAMAGSIGLLLCVAHLALAKHLMGRLEIPVPAGRNVHRRG
ncbi:MAG TPA: carotenoid biosynthesis protein [Blastocatellia bacterium]|nr:carotenoid biosynthesis protein [Blastocatellia bacterium]